ncbi:uncharacterized protein LOC126897529 [Daktulosphaira vitifoliae]|uniref:uncharacterized protein LOC126897529 n=1 Tax=Daktulosphaira vitifoliae TaxID=58002 RepID=UPI0021AACB1D|nr:uncharacterized protein LOC126897529 [Daktulosphaira vitifoliae]
MSSSSLLNWINKRSKSNDECDLTANKRPCVESEYTSRIKESNENMELHETSDLPDFGIKDEYNMKINKSKTKILVCGRNQTANWDINLDGDTLEVFNEYNYLGSIDTDDGKFAQEIRCRLQQACCAFQKKKNPAQGGRGTVVTWYSWIKYNDI